MANMTVLYPWPLVEVMSLSEMNHSSSPEGPPGLFLKSYIVVFLIGGPGFNIVMIPLSSSCVMCESIHAYINCVYIMLK